MITYDWYKNLTAPEGYGKTWFPTGSRFICDPAPMDTDVDCVFLAQDDYQTISQHMATLGWEANSEHYEKGSIQTFRFGALNAIFVFSKEEFDKWILATLVATKLNLLRKSDRIMLFRAIRKGEAPIDISTIMGSPETCPASGGSTSSLSTINLNQTSSPLTPLSFT